MYSVPFGVPTPVIVSQPGAVWIDCASSSSERRIGAVPSASSTPLPVHGGEPDTQHR
jgi:hypothetical protein